MEMSFETAKPVSRPSALLQLLELRAGWEVAAGLSALPWLRLAPRGDGHTVLVLPGLIASDESTRLLRSVLAGRGYDVHGWGMGRNLGPRAGVMESLAELVERMQARQQRPISLIGQSLGGAYARILAAARPDLVRCVITLGSPITGHPRSTNAWRVYEYATGTNRVDKTLWQLLTQAPVVPTTSIYSRSDGIVPWQNSIDPDGPLTESIEVVSSHIGMGAHPAVLYALAERLSQPQGNWQRFSRHGWRALIYPKAAQRAAAPQPA